jgi:serine/threonine protein kinase
VRLPPVGSLLKGRYALGQDDLGEGSFGAVYAAEDSAAPGVNVAVKVCAREVYFFGFLSVASGMTSERHTLRQVFFSYPDAKESYEREVAALELVTRKAPPKAQVVRLVEAFEEGGAFYTVMTPLCRESFEDVIDNYAKHPYSLEQALMWGVELAQITHMLHSTCRLFHGDISTRNVLLGQDDHVYLADLGLAEHNHPYGMKAPLYQRPPTGTEAPEMKEGDRGYDSTAEVRGEREPTNIRLSPYPPGVVVA